MIKATTLILLTVLLTVLLVIGQFSQQTTTFAAPYYAPYQTGCGETTGTVEQREYTSVLVRPVLVYSIYLPPCYTQTTERYPVIYLMHGSASRDTHWLRLGLKEALDAGISDGSLPPMIVVLPFGDFIANENWFDKVSWREIFLNDLMPNVESAYRIDARRESRAIGGISRGGFWAFHIAFERPDLFSVLGGHSAFFDRWHAPAQHNPLNLAADAPNIDTLRIAMDRGNFDYAYENLDYMAEILTQRGIPHTYTVYPEGEHRDPYWASHVAEYLQFYAQDWKNRTDSDASDGTNGGLFRPRLQTGFALYVPAVAFPSLHMSIPMAQLQAVRSGEPDPTLILGADTAQALSDQGITLSPEIRVVDEAELLDALWQDRRAYTLIPFTQLTLRHRMLRIDEVLPMDFNIGEYPFTFPSEGGSTNVNTSHIFDPAKLTRFTFSGVTAVVRDTALAFDEHGAAWGAAGIAGFTRKADFFHMSNEVSFHPTCPFSETRPRGEFCAKDSHFQLFTELGVDVMELSGNHNLDYGEEAYLRTLDMYRLHGIRTVGGGRNLDEARAPLLLQHNDNSIAVISCNWIGPQFALATETTPGAAFCDPAWLEAEVQRLAAEHDIVIVSSQYVEVDSFVPGPRQRADFERLAQLGADAVIGSQAHYPMTFQFQEIVDASGVQQRDPVFIHYGLGNLYFDQTYFQMRSFFDQLMIYDGKLLTVDILPIIIDDYGRPRPMEYHDREFFLGHMFRQNGF